MSFLILNVLVLQYYFLKHEEFFYHYFRLLYFYVEECFLKLGTND